MTDSRQDSELLAQVDRERLPRHVAVIMDGNGRWAKSRGLPRVAGHKAGIESVRQITEASAELGLQVLTLYAFSRENWRRPKAETTTLMHLLREYIDAELENIHEQGIRFKAIGRLEELPEKVRERLDHAEKYTAANEGMLFQVALSYSGRTEIADAARALARKVAQGELDPEEIDEDALAGELYTGGQPDPDLMIRTSGELRVSNYLLWQIAYAELWVTPVQWPDFRRDDLYQALIDYQKRSRRFGGVESVAPSSDKAGALGRLFRR